MVRTYTQHSHIGTVLQYFQTIWFIHTLFFVVGHKNQNLSNNEEEVREEWEKIQIAYNILIDSKTRKRYDRSEIIADPGAAMRRAAIDATLNGVTNIGKGLFSLGQKAVVSLSNSNSNNNMD
jgi:DnaJ-class molecular chaperone